VDLCLLFRESLDFSRLFFFACSVLKHSFFETNFMIFITTMKLQRRLIRFFRTRESLSCCNSSNFMLYSNNALIVLLFCFVSFLKIADLSTPASYILVRFRSHFSFSEFFGWIR
jgi:hypothetical protein